MPVPTAETPTATLNKPEQPAPVTTFVIPDLVKECRMELKCNPYYEEAREAAEAWFDSYKVHTGVRREEFYRAKFCLLGALSYPNADAERLRNCCDFINWLFAFDDLTDDGDLRKNLAGTKKVAEIMVRALEDPHNAKTDFAVGETLRDFWIRAIQTAGPGCQRRFIESTKLYLEAVYQQVVNRSENEIPDLKTFIALRRDTSAVKLVFALIEYACDLDLPDRVASDPIIISLGDCCNDILTWANDIYSYNLEQSWGETQNLIVVSMKDKNLSLQEGVDFVGELIRERIACFEADKARLPSFGSEEVDADVRTYVQGLEHWVSGVIAWSFQSKRYFGDEHLTIREKRIVTLMAKEPEAVTKQGKDVERETAAAAAAAAGPLSEAA
ncbi:hypothetical protein HDU87_000646 [Geranomyces variabilis]|uniref:Terpene synthase n=1 Tax=Geranomyces variabilis TaxID=109894 RepID=A0AAD5XIJ0_9FUNG|nr:hypothetical protein HDU87_000646 [Geranomyces variabilis]